MSDKDPKELADRVEREGDELERRSEELEGRIKAVGEDWERKRADQSVPGAPPPERSDEPEGSDDGDDAEQTGSP
jgi:hypothetical protein